MRGNEPLNCVESLADLSLDMKRAKKNTHAIAAGLSPRAQLPALTL